jgi:hypothetical protein
LFIVVWQVIEHIISYRNQQRAVYNRSNLVLNRFGDQQPANLFERLSNRDVLEFLNTQYMAANNLQRAIAPTQLYKGVNSLSVNNSNQITTSDPNIAEGLSVTPLAPDLWLDLINQKPHFMVAGKTGEGKSTTAKALLAKRIVANDQFIIIDPQSNGWFNFATIGNGWNWGEIIDAITLLYDEYMQRHQQRAQHLKDTGTELPVNAFPRITAVLDEAFEVSQKLDVTRKRQTNYWELYAETLGSGARIVNMSAAILTQTANVEDIGLSGPLRDNFQRIAVDARAIKLMIKQDELDDERRAMLYGALIDLQYPATTVIGTSVELLDRTGLDRIVIPPTTQAHVYPFVRSESASSIPSEGLRTNEPDVNALLSALRSQGVTRDQARNVYKLQFTDTDWTNAV